MLSQLVVLFTFSVIQSMSEQFKCEVIPFETNDVRGTCCIHLKNNFRRPSKEEIDRQILENVFERRNQATPENDQRHFGENGQNRNGEFGNRPKTYPVTENVNGYGGSTSRRVPFIEHIDLSRVTERNPILFEDTNHMNSDRRDYNEYNRGSSVDTGFNSKADESLNTNTKFKIRPLPDNVRNENPKSSTATEKTFSQIEKSYNQKKVDRNIFQGKNESNSNFINRTKGDDEHIKPQSNNTIPDLGNRNNVNVPDTCTEGYARNANGKCVKIFQ
ncbi:uncharacterized protein [Leptinotarsa decemlineata]|uniref:uncharacterized protein n=1 Tax=Leptinotarsa decemlineata TaxID=7539 RepID=UPI003D307EB1